MSSGNLSVNRLLLLVGYCFKVAFLNLFVSRVNFIFKRIIRPICHVSLYDYTVDEGKSKNRFVKKFPCPLIEKHGCKVSESGINILQQFLKGAEHKKGWEQLHDNIMHAQYVST